MQEDKKYLLSTRPLAKGLVEEGARRNVIIEELSFLSVEPVNAEAIVQKIKSLAAEKHTVVFTSMNAVEAVAACMDVPPDWKIYSIGNTTRKLIEEKFGAVKVAATAENAQRLGERLIDDGVKAVVFFCGNIRRNELPNKLRSEGGRVEEVVVYNTQEVPVRLTKTYDGILFFSPSAVEAFYRQNNPDKGTMLFAIGKTTAEELQKHKAKKVVVASVTDKSELTRQAIDYLAKEAE